MTQNIYRDAEFFSGYGRSNRSNHGLDTGCGYGWLCRWAGDRGACVG
ncbi:hypothetical protein [Caballeronia sp. INSB1]